MDDVLGILVLIGVILFPVIWWFLNDRSGSETHDYPQTPQEATRDVPYGEPRPGYGSVPPRQYAEQRTDQPYASAPPAAGLDGDGLGTPVWAEAKSLEEDVPLEREYVEPRSLEDAHVARGSVHTDSLMEEGGPRETTPRSPQLTTVRTRRSPRRAVMAQLRSRQGLRQAVLLQAVIGPPKALQEEDDNPLAR